MTLALIIILILALIFWLAYWQSRIARLQLSDRWKESEMPDHEREQQRLK